MKNDYNISEMQPFDITGKETITTASGLKFISVSEGSGVSPVKLSEIQIEYNLYLNDASMTKVASTTDYGAPIAFMVGINQVIRGLDEGVKLMKEGGRARIIIPDSLAFGKSSATNIPANSSLIMDIVLVSVLTDTKLVTEITKFNNYADSIGITSTVTPSGLYYVETTKGTGDSIKFGDNVSIYYTIYDLKGKQIQTNKGKDKYTFKAGSSNTISGVNEGVLLMRNGGKAKLYLPTYLAYGRKGIGTDIVPYQSIIFELEIANEVEP